MATKVKCVVFRDKPSDPAPDYKELEESIGKGLVLYGKGKRKSSNVPYLEDLPFVEEVISKRKTHVYDDGKQRLESFSLFLLKDGTYDSHIQLVYLDKVMGFFELDERAIQRLRAMHAMQDYLSSIETQIHVLGHVIPKMAGDDNFDDKLLKPLSSFVDACNKMTDASDKALDKYFAETKKILTSGWSGS